MSESESAAGRELGDFRILRELGRGGMGTVYLAEQCSLRRTVALKVLNPGVSLNPNVVKRFQREAESAGRLHHPYIVQVFAVGEESGTYFFAMEYVEGESLDQIIRRLRKGAKIEDLSTHPSQWSDLDLGEGEGEKDPNDAADVSAEEAREGDSTDSTASETQEYILGAARLMGEIADALDYAHRHGIIHRDVKPHNILVDRTGRPYLVDFGLAQAEGTMGITKTGEVFGTPTYMSPEQVAGSLGKIDHRTDIYSLGCSFYELLTLHRPFEGKTPQETVRRILTVEPKDPCRLNKAVPKDLSTIVVKCIEKDPDKRYRTAAELQADLKRFLAGEPILARPIGAIEKTARFVSRRVWQSAAVAVIAVLLITVAFQGFKSRSASQSMVEVEAARLAQEAESLLAVNPEEAERKLAQAFDKDSRCVKAHLVNGKLLRGKGRLDDARVAFDQAARLAPEDPQPYWEAGDLLKGRKEYRAAADLYREALKKNPQLDFVHDNLGECLGELGLRRESTAEYETAEKIRLNLSMPRFEDGRKALAQALELAGKGEEGASAKLAEAESLFSKALDQHPALHQARLWRGFVRSRRGNIAGAMEDLDAILNKLPRDPAGFFFRGELNLAQGNIEEARVDLDRALAIERGVVSSEYRDKALFLLAQIAVSRREWDKAMMQIDALLTERERSELRFFRALCFAMRGEFAEASADFARAEAAGGVLASESALGRAFVLEKQGSALKAYAELVEAEKRYPGNAKLSYHRGRIGIGLRREDASDRKALDRAIALDPRNAGAYLARFSARIAERGAETDFFEALDLDPEFTVAHFFEGMRGDFSGWTSFDALAPESFLGLSVQIVKTSAVGTSTRFLSPRWREGTDLITPSCTPEELRDYIDDLRSTAQKARERAERQLFDCGWNALAALRTSIESPQVAPELQSLLDRLETERSKAELRQMEIWLGQIASNPAIAKRVADLESEALPALLSILAESADPAPKYFAYKSIVELGKPEIASSLIPLLNDSEALVRFYALRAMTRLGNIPSPETLRSLFQGESSAVRIAVLLAAGMAGDLEASLRSLLADSLSDAWALTRFIAARLIGDRHERSLIPALRAGLTVESEAEVREQMYQSLAVLGEEGASLWEGLRNEVWGVDASRRSGPGDLFLDALPGRAGKAREVSGDTSILLSKTMNPDFFWVRVHWIRHGDVPMLIRDYALLKKMSDSDRPAERFAGQWALRRLGLGSQAEPQIPPGSEGLLARSLMEEPPLRAMSTAERESLAQTLQSLGFTEDLARLRRIEETMR